MEVIVQSPFAEIAALLVLAAVIGFLAHRFIAPLTVSVFLYYSTRRYFKSLRRLRLPKRVRAATVLAYQLPQTLSIRVSGRSDPVPDR